jgi:hypothetical protein
MKTSKPVKSAGRPKKAATAAKAVKSAKSVPAKKTAASKGLTSKKAPGSGSVKAKTVKTKKVASVKPGPTEEEIRARATEIYNERVSRGEFGSPEEDWFRAIESLKKK